MRAVARRMALPRRRSRRQAKPVAPLFLMCVAAVCLTPLFRADRAPSTSRTPRPDAASRRRLIAPPGADARPHADARPRARDPRDRAPPRARARRARARVPRYPRPPLFAALDERFADEATANPSESSPPTLQSLPSPAAPRDGSERAEIRLPDDHRQPIQRGGPPRDARDHPPHPRWAPVGVDTSRRRRSHRRRLRRIVAAPSGADAFAAPSPPGPRTKTSSSPSGCGGSARHEIPTEVVPTLLDGARVRRRVRVSRRRFLPPGGHAGQATIATRGRRRVSWDGRAPPGKPA